MRRLLQSALPAASKTLAKRPRLLLVMLAAALTLGMQYWVGGATIYRSELVGAREALHSYILHNELPPGQTWTTLGAHSSNIRIGVVLAAEVIHRSTGVPVYFAYKAIDTAALFAGMLLLFVFVRRWVPDVYAVLALLYFAAITPLTYFLHIFHPWDRPALVVWLVCLLLLRAKRLGYLAAVLPVAVAIKFDVMVLPVLYLLASVTRENWQSVTWRTVAMLVLTVGTYIALRLALPGGFDSERTPIEQVALNLRDFAAIPLFYPPLLVFGLPILLGLAGWTSADRFARACWVFAVILTVPLWAKTNFREVRAEMPLMLLFMPCATLGLRAVLERNGLADAATRVAPKNL